MRSRYQSFRRFIDVRRAASTALVAAVTMAAACADDDIAVKYAADYHHGPANLSFFGVFKDGRPNAESWDPLDERFAKSFAGYPCQALYGPELIAASPDLVGAIDSYAREEGISDDLLDKLAPMAKGDTLVVLTIAGHPPQLLSDAGARAPSNAGMGNPRGGGGRRGRMNMSPAPTAAPTDRSVFELAATLYSIRTHHSVAAMSMSYSGTSADEVIAKFTDRFATELAGSKCSGWSFDHPADAEAIKKMADEPPAP